MSNTSLAHVSPRSHHISPLPLHLDVVPLLSLQVLLPDVLNVGLEVAHILQGVNNCWRTRWGWNAGDTPLLVSPTVPWEDLCAACFGGMQHGNDSCGRELRAESNDPGPVVKGVRLHPRMFTRCTAHPLDVLTLFNDCHIDNEWLVQRTSLPRTYGGRHTSDQCACSQQCGHTNLRAV